MDVIRIKLTSLSLSFAPEQSILPALNLVNYFGGGCYDQIDAFDTLQAV